MVLLACDKVDELRDLVSRLREHAEESDACVKIVEGDCPVAVGHQVPQARHRPWLARRSAALRGRPHIVAHARMRAQVALNSVVDRQV